MNEKLMIANQLRISRKSFSDDLETRKLCSKCYKLYVVECIIKRKENFKITFGSRYIQSFSRRILDWCIYIKDIILIPFAPNGNKTLIKDLTFKPIHFKIPVMPNEKDLYEFLEQNGFKITDEHLYSNSTVYEVARAENKIITV